MESTVFLSIELYSKLGMCVKECLCKGHTPRYTQEPSLGEFTNSGVC